MDDKLKIIELLKRQVTAKTAELTTENIQKTTQDIQDLLKILNDVAAIDFVATPSETPNKQEPATTSEEATIESPAPKPSVTTQVEKHEQVPQQPKVSSEPEVPLLSEHWLNNHKSYIGRFHLDLNGGHVGSIKVSESKLHKMSNPPENGDWVRADEYKDGDSVNYKMTTLKRDPLPTDIVRLKFLPAVFRQDVKRWYIEFKSPEHETTQQLLLGDYDVMLFKLKPGDYIDYAYRRGQEIDGKIIWRYTNSAAVATRMKQKFAKATDTESNHETAASRQTQYKATVNKPAKRKQRALQQVFANKQLLLVCIENSGMPRKVKRNVEERGGKLILSPRSDSNAMLKKKVQKADMVIVPTDFVDHGQMFAAKDEAKRIGKPIWMAKNTNERNMLQWYKRHFPNEAKAPVMDYEA
ncbi:hypothetical protein FD51_GL002772 [Lacticaseibacillus zeae DSM 20178 = KCTC 3804]|uniref:DUF2325 domain-containing protein n=1 Tax=Lacticaseibacillus zeae DSM 20178 = KCTC 3804 TaxID=1423816 RepID=A0A0R1ET39_LACZE|nr:DUF2325 domain-containing protein [Lacticaseibacillus zeae]KRK12425.1 hypothetical protein FD51_GL002772 [Lacticaseibacillus zeae DSM 20178 = KCTC 3804]OLS04711.1 hypothetical protein AUQ39_13330 [Lacticaseibacillus casei]QVI32353.1 DUF2325 domain-containing protein [Lacticaseibacillus zeae]